MIEIRSRYDDSKILYAAENAADVRTALEEAVKRDASLRGANLRDANLGGASLGDANLRGADLGGANLGGANLRDANLGDAYLRDADLGGASLGGANLRGADLGDANLRDANLRDANLRGANLRGADLGGANAYRHPFWPFYVDFMAVLDVAPAEVAGLRKALVEGRVDGSTYAGECACLVGTIARVRGVGVYSDEISHGLGRNADRPAEQWFMAIAKGDTPTPEGQQFASEGVFRATLALRWLDEWIETRLRIGQALMEPVEAAFSRTGEPCEDESDCDEPAQSESGRKSTVKSGTPHLHLSAVFGDGRAIDVLVDGDGARVATDGGL